MFEKQPDCQLVQIEMFVFVPSPDLSREHGGCLRSSLLLSMILELTQDVNRQVVFLFDLTQVFSFDCSRHVMSMMEYCLWPVVQNYFCNIVQSKCSFIWIPSSASTPQVGFLSMTTSPTREETSKFQGHRRRTGEVWCSGVPLWSLAGF